MLQSYNHVRHSASSDTVLAADREYVCECYNCKSTNLIARNRPKLRLMNNKHGRGQGHSQCYHSYKAKYMRESGEHRNDPDISEEWLMDSGTTGHTTAGKSVFRSYQLLSQPQNVVTAGGHTVDAIVVGDIPIAVCVSKRTTRCTALCEDFQVPNLARNLFSIISAVTHGKIVLFGHTRAWAKDKTGQTYAMGTRVAKPHINLKTSNHPINL